MPDSPSALRAELAKLTTDAEKCLSLFHALVHDEKLTPDLEQLCQNTTISEVADLSAKGRILLPQVLRAMDVLAAACEEVNSEAVAFLDYGPDCDDADRSMRNFRATLDAALSLASRALGVGEKKKP